MLNLSGLVGFTAAYHFRVSVRSNFGLLEKQKIVTLEASQKWSTIAQRVNLGPTLTWDWEGRCWGEHRLVSSENILVSLISC